MAYCIISFTVFACNESCCILDNDNSDVLQNKSIIDSVTALYNSGLVGPIHFTIVNAILTELAVNNVSEGSDILLLNLSSNVI